jgi:hypothetical protein
MDRFVFDSFFSVADAFPRIENDGAVSDSLSPRSKCGSRLENITQGKSAPSTTIITAQDHHHHNAISFSNGPFQSIARNFASRLDDNQSQSIFICHGDSERISSFGKTTE